MSFWEEQYFDDPFFDEPLDHGEVFCKYCDAGPFEWEEARGEHNRKKWVLTDDRGNIHDCRKLDPATEFENLNEGA